MKDLVEVIAKALVDHPDEVSVSEKENGRSLTVELHVAPSDMGKVIGKQGRIAKAIRTVVKAAAMEDNKKVDVDIILQKQGAVCEMRGYMEERLQVGVIASTHGVHGEVKIFPTTDDVRRFKKLKEVILDTGKENRILEIESVKFFKQFAILKFRGIDTIDEAEKYRRKSLYVTRENAVRLQKDEYFIADLIGVKVLDEQEQELGTLEDVIETGANDVYQIRLKDGRQLLLPAIKECVLDVDVEAGRMKIHILDGLLED